MSASLVGSEMCIRDRPTISGRPIGSGRGCSRARAASWRVVVVEPQACDCLLYTSDAADDM
eukprot:94859-Alexandrium_andersonii.AAC.1